MSKITVASKTHGVFETLVDRPDLERIEALGGKWCVVIKRGKPYFQKRFTGDYIKELHRWIMGDPKGKYIDHISGNTLDNRRSNLRICSNSANLRNVRKNRPNNTSGRTGVWFVKRDGKWASEIKVNYKKISLGRYKAFNDAVEAREQAEKTYWHI